MKKVRIFEALFIVALMIMAVGVAKAGDPLRDGVGDVVQVPEGWQPFQYNEAIPLAEDLQCILWGSCIENGVPYEYALAIIQTESGFRTDASSGVAHGLMQLHGAYYPADLPPGENIIAGIKLLGDNYKRCGNWPAAVTAYAVGHDDGSRWYWSTIKARAREWRGVLQNAQGQLAD